MDCTVVVATLGGPWLTDQLTALAAQELPPTEVIVVNNGVPGAIDETAAAFRGLLPQLTVREDNTRRGAAYARNVGAGAAAAPGILFVDDDDVISTNYVAEMGLALDRADLVSARIRLDMLNPPRLVRGWEGLHESGPMDHFDFLPWTFGGALGCRREVFERTGGFDPDLLTTEDVDFCWRAQLDHGVAFAYVPEATVNYRLRAEPGAAFRQSLAWGEAQVGLYRRYRDRGLRAPSQLRAAARWARSAQLLLSARNRLDLAVAARHAGSRVGRLRGSVRYRCLFL